jgi:hypothetical protein
LKSFECVSHVNKTNIRTKTHTYAQKGRQKHTQKQGQTHRQREREIYRQTLTQEKSKIDRHTDREKSTLKSDTGTRKTLLHRQPHAK